MSGAETGVHADRYCSAEFCAGSNWTRLHKLLEANLCAAQLAAHLHSKIKPWPMWMVAASSYTGKVNII